MEDRRARTREHVWFPLAVTTESGEENTAITYDASATGLRMGCPGRLPVAARVTLRFRRSPGAPEEATITGTVVRVEPNEDPGPWRFVMAVRFDREDGELEAVLAEWREA